MPGRINRVLLARRPRPDGERCPTVRGRYYRGQCAGCRFLPGIHDVLHADWDAYSADMHGDDLQEGKRFDE